MLQQHNIMYTGYSMRTYYSHKLYRPRLMDTNGNTCKCIFVRTLSIRYVIIVSIQYTPCYIAVSDVVPPPPHSHQNNIRLSRCMNNIVITYTSIYDHDMQYIILHERVSIKSK